MDLINYMPKHEQIISQKQQQNLLDLSFNTLGANVQGYHS